MNEKQLSDVRRWAIPAMPRNMGEALGTQVAANADMRPMVERLLEERRRLLAGLEGLLLDVGVTASDPKDPSLTIGESRALVAIAFAEEEAP